MAPSDILELRQVTKEYLGTAAVKDVDFSLRKGEIHAVLGENGAGKSTLTKMIAGAVAPTSGEILLEGKAIRFANPAEALDKGIAMVFQETSLIPTLTVAQNLYLGKERLLNRLRGVYISAQQFFQSLNFDVDPTALVSSLGAAKKQMVEIARAMTQSAKGRQPRHRHIRTRWNVRERRDGYGTSARQVQHLFHRDVQDRSLARPPDQEKNFLILKNPLPNDGAGRRVLHLFGN